MNEQVDLLIDQASEVAASVGERTVFARVYRALVEERQKVLAVQRLVQDRDGDWVDPDAFDGLAGAVQSLVKPTSLVDAA